MDLNDLRDAIYADAVEHGLWKDAFVFPTECQAMIENEADELYEAATYWEDDGVDRDDPDEHFTEELADVIIMSLSVAGYLGIDIDAAVKAKMEVNKNRPWKHGKDTNVPTGNGGGSVGNGGGGYVGNGGEGDTKTKITLLD